MYHGYRDHPCPHGYLVTPKNIVITRVLMDIVTTRVLMDIS